MKRFLALLLFLAMLVSSAAAEEVFVNDAQKLLNSVNLNRDMLTLKMSGEENAQAKISAADGIVDLTMDAGDEKIRIQFLNDQVYLAAGGSVFNLKYADLESMLTPKMDMYALGGLFQLAFTRLILSHVQLSEGNGMHVSYEATGTELLNDAAGLVDAVLAEEKYQPLIAQILDMLGRISGETMPTLEQLTQMWPQAKEELLAEQPDFRLAFNLDVDGELEQIYVEGEVGSGNHLYRMEWVFSSPDGNRLLLNGKLTERFLRADTASDYDITVNADINKGIWSFDIDDPAKQFNLKAEGTYTDRTGNFSLTVQRSADSLPYFLSQGNYAVTEDSLSVMMNVTDRRTVPVVVSAVIGKKVLDVSVTTSTGTKPFAVKILQENDKVLYADFEITDRNEFYKGVYDGEKVTLSDRDMNIICTGAFESDHAYVVTLHPEFITHPEQTSEDAYIRLEYEGEEGNFTFTGKVIDPEGAEALRLELVCEPTDGIPEKLSDAPQILYLTPETILQMMH